jgi:adenylate cyclase
MKRTRKRRIPAYCAIIGISTLIGLAAAWIPFTRQLELRTYDYRFRLRGALPESSSPPITLLLIDEESLDKIRDPLMLWHGYFGEVLNGLTDAGAATVGLDFLFSDIDRIDSAQSQKLNEALIRAGEARLPVTLSYQVRENGPERPPVSMMMAAAAGRHGLAFANLTNDSDDFIRRQTLKAPVTTGGADYSPSFALQVAQAFALKTGRSLPSASADTILINYRQRDAFPKVSFVRALEAIRQNDTTYMRATFRNRIVLIARAGGRGAEDMHSTPQYFWSESPSDGFRTSGAEIHANTVATLLKSDALHEMDKARQALLVFLCAAVMTALWSSLRTGPASGATLVWMALLAVFSLWAFSHGVWTWVVSPVTACACAIGLTQSANYLFEGRLRRRLQDLFGRYVSDQVITQLLDRPEGVVLDGERRKIAVLFADIRNFTTRSESAKPEDIVDLLNEYFKEVVGVIQTHGGTVNSLMGDGIMAMFGAPIADPDAALHAVEAAREMLQAVERVNARLVLRKVEPIKIGVGINAGDAVIGNMGSPRMMEYTAIGDVVNTASRIEGKTKELHADILIGQAVFEWIAERIPSEPCGEIHVKGRVAAVPVYAVRWNDAQYSTAGSS